MFYHILSLHSLFVRWLDGWLVHSSTVAISHAWPYKLYINVYSLMPWQKLLTMFIHQRKCCIRPNDTYDFLFHDVYNDAYSNLFNALNI